MCLSSITVQAVTSGFHFSDERETVFIFAFRRSKNAMKAKTGITRLTKPITTMMRVKYS